MYFTDKEETKKYIEMLTEKEILVTDITIHTYWNLEFRTYAYKDKETKEKHINEMITKGWINNESKQKECIFSGDEKIWIEVNQFKRFSEINQDEY